MAKYSDLIGSSRTRDFPIRSQPLDPVYSYESENGVITFMADWCDAARFTSNQDGDIVTYTPFWPRRDGIGETFYDISGVPTEDGIVIGFENHWAGYEFT